LAGLAQLPVLATIYRLVVVPTIAGSPNLLLAAQLFGAPMAAHWLEVLAVGGLMSPGAVAFVVLVTGLLVLATLSSRDAARFAPAPTGPSDPGDPSDPSDLAATVQRVVRFLPFGTVVVALFAPVAMGIYLLVSTAWALAERRALHRLIPA
jgi:YidC/Oxa1 family membrane protein insertase